MALKCIFSDSVSVYGHVRGVTPSEFTCKLVPLIFWLPDVRLKRFMSDMRFGGRIFTDVVVDVLLVPSKHSFSTVPSHRRFHLAIPTLLRFDIRNNSAIELEEA